MQLTDITVKRVTDWRTGELKRKRSASGINRDVNSLRSILSKAVEFEVIEASPLRNLKKLKVDQKKRIRHLSDDEEKRLRMALDDYEATLREKRTSFNQWLLGRQLEAYPEHEYTYVDHVKPIVLLALNTGMRIGELFNLRWSHVNLSHKTVTVSGDGSKNGQTRYIPLTNEANDVLRALAKQNMDATLVFPSPKNGGRLDNINSAWTTVRKLAGLYMPGEDGHFRFHDLRHTYASNLALAGVDLNHVRELLGHESIDMTLKYAHLTRNP